MGTTWEVVQGRPTYSTSLEFDGERRYVYGGNFLTEPVLPEVANADAITRYVTSEARWGALISKAFYKRPNGRKFAAKGGMRKKT